MAANDLQLAKLNCQFSVLCCLVYHQRLTVDRSLLKRFLHLASRTPHSLMATHSGILARRIPWMEELGRLQSMGLQRVRHD